MCDKINSNCQYALEIQRKNKIKMLVDKLTEDLPFNEFELIKKQIIRELNMNESKNIEG